MDDIKFDKKNYRKHSDKNKAMISKSLSECGAGRSILIDSEGEIIAGNGVYEQAKAKGIPVKVVETDGSELVVVKRTDLKTEDEKRKKLALADNATSDRVEWDMDTISVDFDDYELGEWGIECEVEGGSPDDYGDDFSLPNEGKAQFGTMTFTVTDTQRSFINECLSVAMNCEGFDPQGDNKNKNGEALYLIVKEWFGRFNITEEDFANIEKDYKDLRTYMCEALRASGHKASEIDQLLGTSGMSGHYFGESQWMFPTREAYEKLKTILPLNRDYMECKLKELAYNRVKKTREINGTL